MSVMVLDAGNSIIKAKIARRENGEIAFPHAMKRLTDIEYEKITNRAGLQNKSVDYLRINGQSYVAGESAERHGLVTQRTGTARYTVFVFISLLDMSRVSGKIVGSTVSPKRRYCMK